MTSTQSEISALLDRRSEAARSKDIDQLMSLYSPGVIYFDVVPPLQYVGSDALRGRFLNWFDGFKGSIGQEIHGVVDHGSFKSRRCTGRPDDPTRGPPERCS